MEIILTNFINTIINNLEDIKEFKTNEKLKDKIIHIFDNSLKNNKLLPVHNYNNISDQNSFLKSRNGLPLSEHSSNENNITNKMNTNKKQQ